jgi:hypothetical protein
MLGERPKAIGNVVEELTGDLRASAGAGKVQPDFIELQLRFG